MLQGHPRRLDDSDYTALADETADPVACCHVVE